MSMLGTLAKIAVGVIVVKGVSGMMKGDGGSKTAPRADGNNPLDDLLGKGSSSGSRKGSGSGSVFGGPHSPKRTGGGDTSGGNLEDMLGQILGGSKSAAPSSGGGLGGALDELSRMSTPGKGGAAPIPSSKGKSGGSFGDLLNQSFDTYGKEAVEPTTEHEDLAKILLRAMLQAAKSDGRIDTAEKKKLIDNLGQATREEMDFVQSELAKPIDIDALVGDTPRGAEQQVYMMSVMGIDLDSKAEAEYLHTLAQALGIDHSTCNAIHERLGVPTLYR